MKEKPRKPGTFLPGQSGNPKGRTPLPPEVKTVRKLTKKDAIQVISKALKMNITELEAAADGLNPKTTAHEMAVASVLLRAIKKGDYFALDLLYKRSIGLVKNDSGNELPKPIIIERTNGTQVMLGVDQREEGNEE